MIDPKLKPQVSGVAAKLQADLAAGQVAIQDVWKLFSGDLRDSAVSRPKRRLPGALGQTRLRIISRKFWKSSGLSRSRGSGSWSRPSASSSAPQRAATDVEVHVIEFGTRRVDGVLKQARAIRDQLDKVPTRQDFEAWLAQQAGIEKEDRDRLQNELNSLWGGVPGGWNALKDEARGFFDGVVSEADRRTYLRDGILPQLASVDVIVPALKAMGGAAPPQD